MNGKKTQRKKEKKTGLAGSTGFETGVGVGSAKTCVDCVFREGSKWLTAAFVYIINSTGNVIYCNESVTALALEVGRAGRTFAPPADYIANAAPGKK
ncbi:MAG TPA: hypothetical protein VEF34_20245 [Syntrophobacteraceae bacterium]|nr:hypothetical protein [Syntrophobacteraceae bacterium]